LAGRTSGDERDRSSILLEVNVADIRLIEKRPFRFIQRDGLASMRIPFDKRFMPEACSLDADSQTPATRKQFYACA
jgi:hypothetical protein